jgi:hypothetical protein
MSDLLVHSERTSPTRSELMLGTQVQGLRRAVEESQPDPGTNVELQLLVVGIVVFLCQLLGLNQALACFGKNVVAVPEKCRGCLRASRPGAIGQNRLRRAALHNLKRRGPQS